MCRLRVAVTTALLLVNIPLLTRTASSSPITYDFSGTLGTPVDGSEQYSGSVTFDMSSFHSSGPSYIWDTSNPLQFTLNLGHHSATIDSGGVDHGINIIISHDDPSHYDSIAIHVVASGADPANGLSDSGFYGNRLEFLISMDNPDGNVLPSTPGPIPTIKLTDFPYNGVELWLGERPQAFVTEVPGSLTSFTLESQSDPTNIPEPSTIVVFALLGIAGTSSRSRRALHRSYQRPREATQIVSRNLGSSS
jgi:hypothetical protein